MNSFFRGLYVYQAAHIVTYRAAHTVTYRAAHTLTYRAAHTVTYRAVHTVTYRAVHTVTYHAAHTVTYRAAHTVTYPLLSLLLSKRYNSCTVLAFSTIFFHSWRSWFCSIHLRSFIFLRSLLTSSSHLCLGLPTGRVIYGCHLYIFFTMLVSGFLYMCPYQLSLWALT